MKIYDGNRPGAIGFTRGFSLERKHMMGKQMIVEQLIEKHKVMKMPKAMIVNTDIMSVTSRLTPACIYYYYSTH